MIKSIFLQITLLGLILAIGSSCSSTKENVEPRYKIGDLYNTNGIKGIVYQVDGSGQHGLIVSLDQTTAMWANSAVWTIVTGMIDKKDGQKNMDGIMALANWHTNYPAFAWCADKNAAGTKGWFLPAIDQLHSLHQTYSADPAFFNKCLTDNGGTAIQIEPTENFWSSTEDKDFIEGYAIAYNFEQAENDSPLKKELANVRAIRTF